MHRTNDALISGMEFTFITNRIKVANFLRNIALVNIAFKAHNLETVPIPASFYLLGIVPIFHILTAIYESYVGIRDFANFIT